jgi:hypothetical protein
MSEIVDKSDNASDYLIEKELLSRRISKKYITTKILFVTETDSLSVNEEIEEWINIYKWIIERKNEMMNKYPEGKEIMIMMYPWFISKNEHNERIDRRHLKNKDVEYID